ncbi:MAG: methylisocitrate lyase [Firmicutes bacterium]|nr:methylisocitrate lyase [Alicyclobacillaceae bacterium]MCL6497638.1 methylisocitrate lyase [Bacillota bacterium]
MMWEEPIPTQPELAARFRALVEQGRPLVLPGAHDGLAALLARRAGFEALYLSGAAFTASLGLPDLGLVAGEETARRAQEIVAAAGLPLLVDVDTGFGGPINVVRTGRQMVAAGVAAVQVEDQELPKKCGHLSGKRLVSAREMAQKIEALRRTAPSLVVVARTDAAAVEGIEGAIARARIYRAAGAEILFPEALTSEGEFRRFAEAVGGPLLANMTEFGRTPYLTAARLFELGYQVVLFPVTALRVAARAMEEAYRTLREAGTQRALLSRMQTRKELYEIIGYFDYEALDERLARSELPEVGEGATES